MRFLVTTFACIVIAGCGRSTNYSTAPPSTAYTDGFEVIVVETANDGSTVSAQSLTLKEAEATVADNPNFTFTITDTDNTAKLIEANETRQGDFSVQVRVTQNETYHQIHTSFHYGNRTFWYEYKTADGTLTPLSSGMNDLNQDSTVQYQNQAD